MILLELIRGQGSHIFPRAPRDWISEVESHETTLIDWFGEEFFLPDRLFVFLAQTIYGLKGHDVDQTRSPSHTYSSRESSVTRRVYWRLRRITVPFSAWTEPAMGKICPALLATHAVFVFRKKL